MSKNRQHHTNTTQQSSSEPVSEQQSSTEESVNDSEQQISTEESVSYTPMIWDIGYKAFQTFILDITKEQLLICKKDIDTQLLSIDKKFAANVVLDFNKISPELKKSVFDELGVVPKNKPGKKATSTGDKKPRKRDPNSGYKDIEIAGVKYKVALLINTDAQEFWRYGNPEQTAWLTGLKTEQRYAKFGGVERLKNNPELLEEFARIPGAVLVKQADDTYKNYDGKPADAEQPTTAENAE